ncbi:MAG: cytochrome c family protein [Leptospira sp.]|nr:cytochrome c family protein [Leptospira sp.]
MKCFIRMLFAIISFSVLNCSEKNAHGFSKGLKPITGISGQQSSKECQSCHKEIFKEWEGSRHKVAFANDLYRESHSREPLTWCVNCHAPVMRAGGSPENISDRMFRDEGISCIVCHQRGDLILTSRIPKNPKTHIYKEVPEMKSGEFCGHCHQFNFPKGTGNVPHDKFQYSAQAMQNTLEEWKKSFFYGKENCQDCHMEPAGSGREYRTHNFPGGHDKNFLKKSFQVSGKMINRNSLEIRIIGKNIGHAFPTGDLFRTLIVRLLDKQKNEIEKIILRYDYTVNEKYPGDRNEPSKKIRKSNIIPAPVSRGESEYVQIFKTGGEAAKKIKYYELSIHYIGDSNKLWTALPDSITRMVIDVQPLEIEISNGQISGDSG